MSGSGCLQMSSAHLKRFSVTILALIVMAMSFTANAVNVKVDSSENWIGYMNFLTVAGDWKPGGSDWALGDMRAGFTKTNANAWPLNDWAWIKPNTNTYDPTNPFWNNPDGSPGETILEQNFYVDVFTNFAGQTVTFSGTVGTNTLTVATDPTNGYSAYAVVKEFTSPGYGWVGLDQVPLVAGTPFTVSRAIPAGGICQYGFLVVGPNAGPGAGNPLEGISIAVEDADPAITLQPVGESAAAGTNVTLTTTAVGSTALSFQWKKGGANLVDGGSLSGATTDTLTITGVVAADSGDYTVDVSNTAGSVVSDTATLTIFNILITSEPQDLRVQEGSTAAFSASAVSPAPLSYRWFSVIGGVTNVLFDGVNISGAATTNLTLSNVLLANTGTYQLRIYDGSVFVYTSADLLVKAPEDFVNFLENPGFENGKTNESPWQRFESSEPSFGVVQDATDTYFLGGNVDVYEGTYVSYTTFNATWSGIYQDVPAEPGQIFTADMAFYNASGDPLPGGFGATNQSYLEVQFRDAGDGVLQQYTTDLGAMASTNLPPQDVWFTLYATNAGDFGGGTGTDGLYLEAPANTATVRFQVTMNDQGGSVGLGSLYYDSARLLLKVPVELTITDTVGGVDISWISQGATTYQVQYKDNIGDPTWTDLEQVPGTGYSITRSYGPSGQRYYRVLTL